MTLVLQPGQKEIRDIVLAEAVIYNIADVGVSRPNSYRKAVVQLVQSRIVFLSPGTSLRNCVRSTFSKRSHTLLFGPFYLPPMSRSWDVHTSFAIEITWA